MQALFSPHPSVAAVWRHVPARRRIHAADALIPVIIGLVLLTGGPYRVSALAFSTMNASGGPLLWGGLLALAGLAIGAACWCGTQVVAWALRLGYGPLLILGLFFGHAWDTDPRVSLLGCLFALDAVWNRLERAQLYADGPPVASLNGGPRHGA